MEHFFFKNLYRYKFCFFSFYFIHFYFILFYFILFYFIQFLFNHFIQFYFMLYQNYWIFLKYQMKNFLIFILILAYQLNFMLFQR